MHVNILQLILGVSIWWYNQKVGITKKKYLCEVRADSFMSREMNDSVLNISSIISIVASGSIFAVLILVLTLFMVLIL